MTFSSSVGSDSVGSTYRSARHRQADHGRHPLGFPGDAVVMAAVVATFALILSISRPVALFAMEETYYFVLRQLSSVQDFVRYAVSLY